jgi:hypothetical protein
MIGAVIFLIFFILFTLLSLVMNIPPGIYAHDLFNIPPSEYSSLINGIMNGVVYGFLIWLVYSILRSTKKEKRQIKIVTKQPSKKIVKRKRLKHLSELTQIMDVGPRRARLLKAAGIDTISDLAAAPVRDLSERTGIPLKTLSKIIERANRIK